MGSPYLLGQSYLPVSTVVANKRLHARRCIETLMDGISTMCSNVELCLLGENDRSHYCVNLLVKINFPSEDKFPKLPWANIVPAHFLPIWRSFIVTLQAEKTAATRKDELIDQLISYFSQSKHHPPHAYPSLSRKYVSCQVLITYSP